MVPSRLILWVARLACPAVFPPYPRRNLPILIAALAAISLAGALAATAFGAPPRPAAPKKPGKPQLTDVVASDEVGETELLALAASLERASEHPLAESVVAGAEPV